MRRLIMYRRKRNARRIILSILITSFLILMFGISIVDYSVNSMLDTNDEVKIISITKKADSIYTMNFMNCKGEINLSYINRDIDFLTNKFQEIFEKLKYN